MVLRIGHKVPDFSLFDYNKTERRFSEFTQKGTLTIVFFPFAFSGTCDKELCVFRDSLVGAGSLAGSVVGISVDSVFTLKIFAETYDLGFPLLSDFNKKVIKAFDVLQDPWVSYAYRGVAKRSVFVIDRRGVLRYRWVTDIPSEEPPYEQVAAAVAKSK
jgi:peroxiredoxin